MTEIIEEPMTLKTRAEPLSVSKNLPKHETRNLEVATRVVSTLFAPSTLLLLLSLSSTLVPVLGSHQQSPVHAVCLQRPQFLVGARSDGLSSVTAIINEPDSSGVAKAMMEAGGRDAESHEEDTSRARNLPCFEPLKFVLLFVTTSYGGWDLKGSESS